jgi:hypothetical protein
LLLSSNKNHYNTREKKNAAAAHVIGMFFSFHMKFLIILFPKAISEQTTKNSNHGKAAANHSANRTDVIIPFLGYRLYHNGHRGEIIRENCSRDFLVGILQWQRIKYI